MSVFRPSREERVRQRSNAMVAETTTWIDYLWRPRREASAVKKGQDAVVEALVKDEHIDQVHSARLMHKRPVNRYAKELFGTLYGDATPVEDPSQAPGFARMIHDALQSIPEFQQLADSVYGDADFATLATADILESMAPTLAQAQQQQKREEKQKQEGGSNRRRGPSPEELMQAAAQSAVKQAADDSAKVKAAMARIAPGMERAPNLKSQREDDSRMVLAQTLRDDEFVRQVIRRAGRIMRGVGREARKSAGREEVVDIERGSDIARLLPTELAALGDPDLETMMLHRVVTNSALQYQLEGNSPIGRGPMVCLVDRSSSMAGAPFEIACGVTIALAMVACREKRPISVIFFNYDVHAPIRMHNHTPRALADLLRSLRQVRACGGTHFTKAFQAGLQELKELPRADLVFVTDSRGEAIRGKVRTELDERKVQTGLRVWGVTVNRGQVSSAVREVCEEVISLDAADPERAATQLIAGAAR